MPDSQNGAQDEEGYGIYVDEIGAGPYSQFERPSYVLENLKWGTPGLGSTGGTITWAILGSGQSLASNNPYTSAVTSVDPVFVSTIRAAFARWEQVANFDFVETTNPATADMIVAFDELSGQSANTIGLAQYYYIGSRLTRSYISFDLNRRYQTLDGTIHPAGTSSGSGLNLYTLALHEIGHSIGLGHEDDFDTVMNSISDGVLTDLTSDDIAGARAIYGAAGSTPPTVDDYAATTATTGAVTVGGAVTGRVDTTSDEDWFRITLTSGVSYRIDLRGSDTSGGTLRDPYVRLLNSGGSVLSTDDDAGTGTDSQILFTATSSGTYYIAASGFDGEQGTYTLSVTSTVVTDDYAATTATTGAITVGATVTGNIATAADVDWLRVALTAGTLYQFDGRGSAAFNGTLADPTMQLLNSSGTVLRTDNDSGDGSDARILYTPTASGAYYVAMRSTSATATGTYTVGVTANPDDFAATTATTGVASVGSTTSGIVERAGDRDWFRATLTAGTTYSIEVRATSPGSGIRWTESSVILHSSSGATLSSDTRSGLAAAARLTYTPTNTGAFYIDALAFSTGVGAYTVTVTAGAVQETPAMIAQAEAGPTDADLAALTASPAIDLWELPVLGGEQAASLLAQPPAFTLLASYEINSPEDEHRLANTARFDPLFQMQQRTAFDLLPIG